MSADKDKNSGASEPTDKSQQLIRESMADSNIPAEVKLEEKSVLSEMSSDILVNESDDSGTAGDVGKDANNSSLNISKDNESSIKLEIEMTPEGITKVPETQEFYVEESIERSQPSTIEIESSGTVTSRGTLSFSECDRNIHKQSFQHSTGKENIFGKSGQEEDHSLQISQDDLFGSHTGVVASTPQSDFISRVLLPKDAIKAEIEEEEEMIPSSPEEKRKNSSGLPLGHDFKKRRKVSLSLARNPDKIEPSSSPDVMEIPQEVIGITPEKEITVEGKKDLEASNAGRRRINFDSPECQGLESQETIYSGYVDKLSSQATSKESSEKSSAEHKEIKSSGSSEPSSNEYGQKFDDDFDTEPVAAIEQVPSGEDSQELGKETQEGLAGDMHDEDESGRPKCGLKRKLKDLKIVKAKDLILGRRDSSDEDNEVEILDVKKRRESIEVVYSKPTPKSSRKYLSPTAKLSSSYSSSSSSISSLSPNKSYLSRKLSLLSNVAGTKIVKGPTEFEEFTEEEFSLHISPSGSQMDLKLDSPAKMSSEKDAKALNTCGKMSIIMEVDEACTSFDESSLLKAKRRAEDGKSENMDVTVEDSETVDKRNELEVITRPVSPEYLPEDDKDEERVTEHNEDNDKIVEKQNSECEGEKLPSTESCSNGHLSDHNKESQGEDVTLREAKTVAAEEKKNAELKDKNGVGADPNYKTADMQKWYVWHVHVSHKYIVETGEILSTKILEIQCPDETAKNTSKVCGRVSDVSKSSSIDSKASACLSDVSSPPNVSPLNVSGEAKLLPLPLPRASVMSAYSHSSSSTSGSDLAVNIKGKEKPTFTRPNKPMTTVKDREIAKHYAIHPVSVVLERDQAIQKYIPNVKDVIADLEKEGAEVSIPKFRYLTKRPPKGKRLPLRLKKKSSTSSKVASPNSHSPENSRNTEDMDTLPVESLDDSSSPQTPKPINVPLILTPSSTRIKGGRSRSRQLCQNRSSENSSVYSNGVKSSTSSQKTKTAKEEELPCTPRSLNVKSPGVPAGVVTEGALVFAQFSDKWYYPGKVRQQQKDDRWIIDFDDGSVKSVKEEHIVAVDCFEQGQSVYATVGEKDAEYEPGIITKVEFMQEQPLYTVELDIGKTEIFPTSKFCLTEDQVRIVTELRMDSVPSTPKRNAEVSLDNVLEGKRGRGRMTIESAGPSTPGTSKPQTGPRCIPPSVTSSSSTWTSEVSESETELENIPGLEAPDSPDSVATPSSKGKGPGRRKGKAKQIETKEEIAEQSKPTLSDIRSNGLGLIPPKGSSLFKGKYFILNLGASKEVAVRRTRTRKICSDTSSEGDGNKSCDEMQFSVTPFVKKHLKKQLEAGGGIVLDHYDGRCNGKNTFLISNRCNLTPDYVLCLAADIQSVSHDWVISCCIQGESLPWMENFLPVGWSREEERYVEWHERSSRSLKKVEIVLASDSGNKFLEFWRRVLTTAGAIVRKVSSKTMSSQEDISYVRVVVTDHRCPAGILDRANKAGIPLVSTFWVQQSLIHGKMRPFDGHPSFKYNYIQVD